MAHFCKKLQADCRRGWMLALTAMLIVFAPAAFAQSAPTVTGTVTDQSGQPVIGATIIEQGTTNGATTGVDGSYSLKLRGGGNSANLIFQSLGFVSQTVAVNGRTKIDVKLAEDAVALDAVVAIGYGTVKQKDLTTAVSVVKTDDLARRPITSASGALQGKAAGVQVIQPNGSPGQGMVVRVRAARERVSLFGEEIVVTLVADDADEQLRAVALGDAHRAGVGRYAPDRSAAERQCRKHQYEWENVALHGMSLRVSDCPGGPDHAYKGNSLILKKQTDRADRFAVSFRRMRAGGPDGSLGVPGASISPAAKVSCPA